MGDEPLAIKSDDGTELPGLWRDGINHTLSAIGPRTGGVMDDGTSVGREDDRARSCIAPGRNNLDGGVGLKGDVGSYTGESNADDVLAVAPEAGSGDGDLGVELTSVRQHVCDLPKLPIVPTAQFGNNGAGVRDDLHRRLALTRREVADVDDIYHDGVG